MIDGVFIGRGATASECILQSLSQLPWLYRSTINRNSVVQMATSIFPNIAAAVEGYSAQSTDLAIAGYDYRRTISGEHAVARSFTLRAIASAVDANIARDNARVPLPFLFEEWFVPWYPYFCLYLLLCIYEFRRHGFHGGRHSWW
jgi:hypothetical protein